MKYRKLTDSGDYMFGRRDQFHVGSPAVAQVVKTRLGHLQGEWWENTEDGLPLYQEILGSFHAPEQRAEIIDLLFSERILNTEGVDSLIAFESEIDMQTRTYKSFCAVKTDFGEVFNMQINGSGSGPLKITTGRG